MNNTLLNGTKLEWNDILNAPTIANDNTSWNQSYANTLYYPLTSNPLGYLNTTTYQNSAGGWTNSSTDIVSNRFVSSTANLVIYTGNSNSSKLNDATIRLSSLNNTVINSPTTGELFLQNDVNKNTYINPVGGNVGIGVNTNPSYKLHVVGSGAFDVNSTGSTVSLSPNGGASGLSGLDFNSGRAAIRYMSSTLNFSTGDVNKPMLFSPGNAEAARFNGSGYFIIGSTATPTGVIDVRMKDVSNPGLSVQGISGQTGNTFEIKDNNGLPVIYSDSSHRQFRISSYNYADATGASLFLSKRGNTTNSNNATASGVSYGRIFFQGWNETAFVTGASIQGQSYQAFTSTRAGSGLVFSTVPYNSTSLSTRLVIRPGGQIQPGMGGATETATFPQILLSGTGGGNGHVGIGSTVDANSESVVLFGFNSGSNPILRVVARTFSATSAEDSLNTNSTLLRMLVTADGKVSIGNPAKRIPTQTLDVNGSINVSNVVYFTASTVITCNAASAGGIYYNSTTYKHYGCNSTNWNALY
jgi:hypothetical protein